MSNYMTHITLFSLLAAPAVSSAALTVYDGFDYTATQAITGKTGGTGWGGANAYFDADNGSGTVASSGLTYGTLQTTGNAWADTNGAASSATLTNYRTHPTSGLTDNGDSIWMSFLFNIDSAAGSNLNVGAFVSSSSNLFGSGFSVQAASDGKLSARISSNTQTTANSVFSKGTTYLVVARFDFVSGNDSLRVWLDPAIGGAAPSDASATITNVGLAGITIGDRAVIRGGSPFTGRADEFRLGTTFADVTPVPEPAAAVGAMPLLMLARRRRS